MNMIEKRILQIQGYKMDLRNAARRLFESLTSGEVGLVKRHQAYCEGARYLEKAKTDRFGWRLRDVREVEIRGRDNGESTLLVKCGYMYGRRVCIYVPAAALANKAGKQAWLKALEEQVQFKRAQLKNAELSEMCRLMKSNKRKAAQYMEALSCASQS